MAESDFTTPPKSKPQILCDELNTIAARLAGVEDVLREIDNDMQTGNILHLMADIARDANDRLGIAAISVRDLQEPIA